MLGSFPEFQIWITLALIAAFLICLMKEWLQPEVAAMAAFCVALILGLIDSRSAFEVFSNSAPITVAGMFVLSFALQKTGVVDRIGQLINRILPAGLHSVILGICLIASACSAFLNNTPVVAIFIPIVLAIARDRNLPASRLLIPLSYATIMGGCCTLIGTSTNIVVNGIAENYGIDSLGMFDLAKVGLPVLFVGLLYLCVFSPILIPLRSTISETLSEEMRSSTLYHVLVKPDSPLVGKRILSTLLGDDTKFRILEIRRKGARVMDSLDKITIEPFDRLLIAPVSSKTFSVTENDNISLNQSLMESLRIQNLSSIQGKVVEAVITPRSRLIGKTLRSVQFRQLYSILILAMHRHGHNLSEDFQDVPLEIGDTLLMLGTIRSFEELRENEDFLLLEKHKPPEVEKHHSFLAVSIVATVITVASLNILPIVSATTIGCVALVLTGVLRSQEIYKAVDWQIIFLIFGCLGLGLAIEQTGTAMWFAKLLTSIASNFPESQQPLLLLALAFLLTSFLTEILSNNATAAIVAPVVINIAQQLQVSPYPFIVGIMIAASSSFATPIGYQTNTMIYGAGGYKFTDFLRVGIPMNILVFVVSMLVIPQVWKF